MGWVCAWVPHAGGVCVCVSVCVCGKLCDDAAHGDVRGGRAGCSVGWACDVLVHGHEGTVPGGVCVWKAE